jgi:hypothetical protein
MLIERRSITTRSVEQSPYSETGSCSAGQEISRPLCNPKTLYCIFWDTATCSPMKVNRRFGGTCRLFSVEKKAKQETKHESGSNENSGDTFMLVTCLANSLTVKMYAIYSSETSVYYQRTTRRCIPEDRTLNNHRCENLKS